MLNVLYLSVAQYACFDISSLDQDPYIPEVWANEALMRLENTMVMANLVHRDFRDELANFGDVVNTRRPADFDVARKGGEDEVSFQAARSDNVRVPLDQWFSNGFVIKDGDATMSFQELVTKYLAPAADAIANGVDRALLGHIHRVLVNRAGRLGKISSANAGDFLLDAREIMNRNKAPIAGRNLVLSPTSETAFLKNDLFVSAEKRGDAGSALEAALLGRIYGYDTFMGQNVNSASILGADTVTGTVTSPLAAGGSGSQAVSVSGYEVTNGSGEFVVVDGNDQPTYATAATASTNTTAVTLNEANRFGTGAGATVTVYRRATLDGANDNALSLETGGSTYPEKWSRAIRIDGHTTNKGPQQGQLIAFVTGGTRHTYTVIQAKAVSTTVTMVLLDRPLDAALTDGQSAFPGPAGAFNWAFHRGAIALVNRPLKTPASREGVNSAVISYKNLSIRASMQYDIKATGTRVHLDMLAGVAILDPALACVLLG